MKKYSVLLIVLLVITTLAGCENNGQTSPAQKLNADLFKLAHMNGCIDCHRVDATVVGPSWKVIAERYKDSPFEEARDLLIDSVKNGSQGKFITWKGGDGMPPLGKRVSEEHIKQLVEYILSLNTQR